MDINLSQGTPTPQSVDREVIQASLLQKTLKAEENQNLQILASTQLPADQLAAQDTSLVGRNLNVKA